MLKRIIPSIAVCTLILSACNASSSDDTEYVYSSDVAITAFSLLDNDSVLDSLSHVYFSIDLVNAKIYNADSLPYGTPVSRLQVSISTNDASAVSITFPREDSTDSVFDYLNNTTDSIDFSNGAAKVTVTSESGAIMRTYEVKVNVHQVKPDTLAWKELQSIDLPSSFSSVKSQYAAQMGDTFYCLTSSASGEYCMATTTEPDNGDWQTTTVAMPFTPVVTSLRGTESALYILSDSNDLYTSTDGSSWSDTGTDLTYLYGPYYDQVLGTDGSTIIAYPSGTSYTMPEDFPMSGTSLPAAYSSSMGLTDQIVILGGVCADGSLSREAWGFDGYAWIRLSRVTNIPEGLESPTLVAYDLFEVTSDTWSPTQYPALVAFGGKKADGTTSRTVYISKDWGINWSEAPELMALPDDLPALYCQPAFIYSVTMCARSSSVWKDLPVRGIYPFTSYVTAKSTSRAATEPISDWECPGIYIFGGIDAAGNTDPTLWRARIVRYTFKPVQ